MTLFWKEEEKKYCNNNIINNSHNEIEIEKQKQNRERQTDTRTRHTDRQNNLPPELSSQTRSQTIGDVKCHSMTFSWFFLWGPKSEGGKANPALFHDCRLKTVGFCHPIGRFMNMSSHGIWLFYPKKCTNATFRKIFSFLMRQNVTETDYNSVIQHLFILGHQWHMHSRQKSHMYHGSTW